MYDSAIYPRTKTYPPLFSGLTEIVCWSRMQAESGQSISDIVARKELERRAGEGFFCWGVGNPPARSTATFAKGGTDIDVVFSLMRSPPKAIDVAPKSILVWRSYLDFDGQEKVLPENVLLTSRAQSQVRDKHHHYALMCFSTESLSLADYGAFDHTVYRNASESAGSIGASQVTALMRRVAPEQAESLYRINLRAKLTRGYWVKLADPLEISQEQRTHMEETLAGVKDMAVNDWLTFTKALRADDSSGQRSVPGQLRLF